MKSINQSSSASAVNTAWRNIAVLVALAAIHSISFAAFDGGTATDMVGSILAWIKPMSIAVVTIAFIFAGYQIAFGGKRFNDVMPIVIGAIIIGAAGALATSLIGTA
jgi:type IV secretion system protein VirB2